MTLSTDKIAELRVKQLEMLQSLISRTSSHGAAAKNYCVTLVTALCGFSVSLHRPVIAAISLIPILIFWITDAQHLRTERRFRALYSIIRKQDWSTVPNFEIDVKDSPAVNFKSVATSWSVIIFYVPMMVCAIFIFLISYFTG